MPTAKSPSCIPREQLAEFASGKVSADQLDIISAHVDTCVSCQATVASLAEEPDSFVEALQALPHQEAEPADESACQLVVDRLVEHRSLPSRPAGTASPMPASIGAYRVLEPIAAGGMGMVYKAQHPKLKRTVAIKLLALAQWAGSAAVARFQREMEVIGSLDHPNIVRASDAGDADGMHYLVMEFIDGLDLSRLVHRMGPLPMADACEIMRQTARGLEHVHAASLVHRDIKPSNIMLTQDGQVKILDLGLAMLGQQYREVENNLTTIGQLMGTIDYMAPEQAADSRQVDTRADIYSLGATLFKLLTGQAPYGGPSHKSLLKKVLALANAPVPSVREFRPEIPEKLDNIVGRCLAKEPEARYAHAGDVAEALAEFATLNDLPSLVSEARKREDSTSWPLSLQGPMAAMASPARKGKAQASSRRTNWIVRTLVATAAIALIALGTVIIRIATDRGELIVRSEDPNARILITRTDDQSAQEMTVEQGAGKITIKSGHYAVELLGDADRWSLDRNQFTIARGDQIVLQVERKATAEWAGVIGGGVGMPSLVYDGKSYDEWLQVIATERSPTRLLEAVKAIGLLAPETNSEQAAGALLRAMRVYGSKTIDSSSPRGNLVLETLNTLQSFGPEGVVKALATEVSEGNRNSHEFVLLLLTDLKRQVDFTTAPIPLVAAFAPAAPPVVSKLLEMSRDANVDLSHWALQCAGNLAVTLRLDVGRIDGFLPRFTEALQSTDRESAYYAAVILSDFAPFTEGIAAVLADNLGTREDALPSLVRLGPHAAAAVPKLAEILQASTSNAHAAIRRSGPGTRYVDGIAETILSIIEQCAPAGGAAVPVLQKMAEKEGFYQERARQLIERFHVAPAQPADAAKQPSPDGGQ